MKTRNVAKKFGITEEELDAGIDIVTNALFRIKNQKVFFAVGELLAIGDIEAEDPPVREEE